MTMTTNMKTTIKATTDRQRLAALLDEKAIRLARKSFRSFVEWAWPVLEPRTRFLPSWHIDLLCEYLEAVTAGEITRLVINVPPRYMKSLLATVLWPCWEWQSRPSLRSIFSSYAESLASHHSLCRRRLIRSRQYQRFAPEIHLTRDQSEKLEFHNTLGGIMVATSTGGSITGKGGNRLIIDDPHNPTQAESDAQRQQAIDFFRFTLSTRLDDPKHDAIVVMMQRLHTRDLTAICLEQGFEHVCLPALAPHHTTIVFPRSGREVIRELDSPLWPERQDVVELERQRRTLGSYGFAGQYQQQPVPREGGMFKQEWWRYCDQLPAGFDDITQSWDLSFKGGEGNDYVVGLVLGRIGALVYVLDRFKKKASFTETCQAIKQMAEKYPATRAVLVEDAANGPAVINMLQREIRGILAVTPEGGKWSRAAAVQPQVESGQVFLPKPRFADGQLRFEYAWVEDFIEQCSLFPKGDHDDDVDALTQAMVYLQNRPASTLSASYILSLGTRDSRHDDGDDDEHDDDDGGGSNSFGGWGPKWPRHF
jgi:predicted phage terminase large subunit-like protein